MIQMKINKHCNILPVSQCGRSHCISTSSKQITDEANKEQTYSDISYKHFFLLRDLMKFMWSIHFYEIYVWSLIRILDRTRVQMPNNAFQIATTAVFLTAMTLVWFRLILWHMDNYWLFNAKSIFIDINSSISNNSFGHKYTIYFYLTHRSLSDATTLGKYTWWVSK